MYYDATPLLEVQQQEREEEPRSRRNSNAMPTNININLQPQDQYMSIPHGQPSPHRNTSYPYGGSPTNSRFPQQQGNFNPVPSSQFYGSRDASPVRMGGMSHDAMMGMQGRRVMRGNMGDDPFHGI